jgi:hypothetical protein
MGSASESTEVITDSPTVNPGCLGQFLNIFNMYARVFELEDDIQ